MTQKMSPARPAKVAKRSSKDGTRQVQRKSGKMGGMNCRCACLECDTKEFFSQGVSVLDEEHDLENSWSSRLRAIPGVRRRLRGVQKKASQKASKKPPRSVQDCPLAEVATPRSAEIASGGSKRLGLDGRKKRSALTGGRGDTFPYEPARPRQESLR